MTLEHDIQRTFFDRCAWAANQDARYALVFAIPNGAKLPWFKNKEGVRVSPESRKLLEEGMKAGVPDVLLAYPSGAHHGMFIEFKQLGKKMSKEQAEWRLKLIHAGYHHVVAYDAEEAFGMVKDYLEDAK